MTLWHSARRRADRRPPELAAPCALGRRHAARYRRPSPQAGSRPRERRSRAAHAEERRRIDPHNTVVMPVIPDSPVCSGEAVVAGGEEDLCLLGRRVWCHPSSAASVSRSVSTSSSPNARARVARVDLEQVCHRLVSAVPQRRRRRERPRPAHQHRPPSPPRWAQLPAQQAPRPTAHRERSRQRVEPHTGTSCGIP